MKGEDSVEGLIDAVRNYAPPYVPTAIISTVLLNSYLDYIGMGIDTTLRTIRGEHYGVISKALLRVGSKLEGTRKYERTMHVLLKMGTDSSRAALLALGQFMALCRMRCTYRIGLSRFMTYNEDAPIYGAVVAAR